MEEPSHQYNPLKVWLALCVFIRLGRMNVAVSSDLLATSWMVRHAAWLLSHFQAGTADGKTANARQIEKPYEPLVLRLLDGSCGRIRRSSVRSWDDHRQATLTSSAREWASLLLASFDVCRHQNARSEVSWWPCGGTPVSGQPAEAAAGEEK